MMRAGCPARVVAAVLLTACVHTLAHAQTITGNERDRWWIGLHRTWVLYVDKPNSEDINYKPMPLYLNQMVTGDNANPAPEFWKATYVDGFKALVNNMVQPPEKGGDAVFQHCLGKLLVSSPKACCIYLVNDTSGGMGDTAMQRWGVALDGMNRVWPTAVSMKVAQEFRERYYNITGTNLQMQSTSLTDWSGHMAFGADNFNWYGRFGFGLPTAANPPKVKNALELMLHMAVHTLDTSDLRSHVPWVIAEGHDYGGTKIGHSVIAIPNASMAHLEGVAHALGFYYNKKSGDDAFRWFAGNGALWLEKYPETAVDAGYGDAWAKAYTPARDKWLHSRLAAVKPPVKTLPEPKDAGEGRGSTWYAYYRIRDLPPEYIIRNEFVIGMIFSNYITYMGYDKFIDLLSGPLGEFALLDIAKNGLGELFEAACRGLVPAGSTPGKLAADANADKSFLLPLAWTDFFTDYKFRTRDEFAKAFDGKLSKEVLDAYWDHGRVAVREAAPFREVKPEYLKDIAQALKAVEVEAPLPEI